MKKIILLLLVVIPYCIIAQTTYTGNQGHSDVMTFFGDRNFGTSGFTIVTKIPNNERHAATVYIKGFDRFQTIGLQIRWFYDGDQFTAYSASSTGAWIPNSTRLGNTGSEYIQIHFEGYSAIQNLEVIAFSESQILYPDWFNDWSFINEAGEGIEVPYINKFGEAYTKNLYSEGVVNGANATITNNLNVGNNLTVSHGINTENLAVSNNTILHGKLGIGATLSSAAVPLHTQGGVRFEGLADGITANQVLSTDASGNLTLVNKGGYWQPHTNASTVVYNGIVGIGITPTTALNTSSTYKLVVGGTIGATKVKVTQGGWADYVFADSYKLQPLAEVEKFVKANKHLEGVPTAKEVKENGVDLGDTQVILLKKIEELTLHLIEQNKKLEKQNTELEEQNKKIERLENGLKKIFKK